MTTRVINLETASYSEAIGEAVSVLSGGGLVVFPTETVYGVGACAFLPEAVRKLRVLKSRTDGRPFTLHLGQKSAIHRFVPGLAGPARRLIEKTWPGPLTVIFEVSDPQNAPAIRESSPEHIPAIYHDGTIGARCPDDHVAADLLTQTPLPVVAASANLPGNPASVSAEEALADLSGRVDLMLDAGRSRYAKASTIVRVDADGGYRVLREGVLDERTVQRMNRTTFLLVCTGNTCRSPMAAGLLRRILAEKLSCREDELPEKGYHVESAGTGAYAGAPATPEAVQALRPRGIDIAGHRSWPLTLEQVNRADYIFAMTGQQAENVRALGPQAEARLLRLDDEDIEDPIGGSEEEYAACANRIENALRRRLEEVVL